MSEQSRAQTIGLISLAMGVLSASASIYGFLDMNWHDPSSALCCAAPIGAVVLLPFGVYMTARRKLHKGLGARESDSPDDSPYRKPGS